MLLLFGIISGIIWKAFTFGFRVHKFGTQFLKATQIHTNKTHMGKSHRKVLDK